MEDAAHHIHSLSEDGRYRLLVEAVTDYAIYMLDPAGIITSWNPGAQRFKGYTANEIVGKHFSQFYSDEDRAKGIPERALKTAASEGKFENEGWRIRKDGTRFWAYVVIDPIRTPDGKIVGYAKITRDLTERRAAEEALRRSEEQFRLLVQGVTDYAIYMLDKEGHVTNWNLGAQRIKGYMPAEIIGKHFSQFYSLEDRLAREPEEALDRARREGRIEREGWRVRKDGTQFWAHVIIDAIRDDHGELIGYAKITRDITERRKAQQELERTREVLLQSQKMEAIGQLTGGIAHDFNNLLMAVLGSLDLMRKRLPDDPRLLSLLENAVQGAKRGTLLTQRMLSFARRQELKQEPVDIPDLVRGMKDLLQRSLGPSVSIDTHFALVTKPVLADANQLEMALLNLVVNARDAMPEGGNIVIATRQEAVHAGNSAGLTPGPYICLSVTDTGEGMDAATLRRATEPFFTTKGVGKGTGLGLSMVHGMAQQSGGSFTLQSKLGKGTTVELRLPVASGAAEAVPAASRAAEDIYNQPPLVVLAVDDDSLVLTNTIAMLEELGHTGIAAASGEEALRLLEESETNGTPVDLVLTDQAMPRITGVQLAEAIRRRWDQMPIIIATGFAEIEPGLGTELPRLAKPFNERDLAREIAFAVPAASKGEGQVLRFRAKPGG
jgi:PAS domain S-box-containing protein